MGFYLLDHPNPHGPHYYTTRNAPIRRVVIHTAESLPDFDPPDMGAESVARYGATTDRQVSWHATADSDSLIPMLPDSYTAWHVSGYNSTSLGIEIATQAHRWKGAPRWWIDATLARTAKQTRKWCQRHGIPMKRVTDGRPGIVAHASLDPANRSDPGPDFPWDDFIKLVKGGKAMTMRDFFQILAKAQRLASKRPTLKRGRTGMWVLRVKRWLDVPVVTRRPCYYNAHLAANVRAFQRFMGIPATGKIDEATWTWLIFARIAHRRGF